MKNNDTQTINAIAEEIRKLKKKKSVKGNTSSPTLDIFSIVRQGGEPNLRSKLKVLELTELRKLITWHGFNKSSVIHKWTKDKLIDAIVQHTILRTKQGNAFITDKGEHEKMSHVTEILQITTNAEEDMK